MASKTVTGAIYVKKNQEIIKKGDFIVSVLPLFDAFLS